MQENAKTIEQLLKGIDMLNSRLADLDETISVILNAASDLAFLVDSRGTIIYINEAAAGRLGKKTAEMIATKIDDYYSDEERESRNAYMEVVKFSGQPVHFEEVYKDGVFATRIYPIFNPQGEIAKFAVFYNDITEHKKNEETIYRYSQIFSTISAPMSFVDQNHIFRTANDAYLKVYGKKREEVIGRPIEEVFGREVFQEHIKESIEKCLKGERVQYQGWFHLPGDKFSFMYMSYNPLFTINRKVMGAVISAVDITENREAEEKLKQLYITDQMTGIFNRAKFCEAIDEEIRSAAVNRNKRLSIVMFDIDHFKNINDTYGHDVGDEVIKKLVGVVKGCIRESDIFARWGGEEFMILLPDADLEIAYSMAERIRSAIEKSPFGKVDTVTCCFGIAQFLPGDSVEVLTKRVDKALYKAKQRGRNRVEKPKTVAKL